MPKNWGAPAPSVATYVRAGLGTISARARGGSSTFLAAPDRCSEKIGGSVENIGACLLWENQGQARGDVKMSTEAGGRQGRYTYVHAREELRTYGGMAPRAGPGFDQVDLTAKIATGSNARVSGYGPSIALESYWRGIFAASILPGDV